MTSPTQSAMEQQQREELLPCPLCGGAMSVRTNRDWHRLVGEHADNCLLADFEPYYAATPKDRDALVSAWNRRESSELRSLRDSLALARSHIGELREALNDIIAQDIYSPEGGHETVAEIRCIARAALNKEKP